MILTNTINVWKRFHKTWMVLLIGVFIICSGFDSTAGQHGSSTEDTALLVQVQPNQDEAGKNTMSIQFTNITLKRALELLAEKINVGLSYNPEIMPNKKITLEMTDVPASDVLYKLLEGTGLEPVLPPTKDVIIIRERRVKNLQDNILQQTITGSVVDAETEDALPGVNILIMGTSRGTSTNIEGDYSLNVSSLQDTLVFSFIGYETQQVPINGRSVVDIEMEESTVEGQELIVVGYATQEAAEVTGSISRINADQLNTIATSSVNSMLRGKAPGLNLRQRTAQPGGGVSVNIRGAISPNGNNTPLYVIDGVPITNYDSSVPGLEDTELGFYGGIDRDPLSYLNPSDIQDVTVLKDASATAIYGSAAANGVVLITTKRGRSGDISVEYRGSYTKQNLHDYFPLLNAQQFMRQQDRLAYDKYLFDNRIAPYGNTDPSSVTPYNPLFSESEINGGGAGTDWIGLITEDGYINEHNIAVSGGSDNTIVYASFNFQSNDAVLKGSSLDKYTGRVNLDQYIGDNIHLSVKTTASRQIGNNASTGTNDGGVEKYNMLQAAYSYAPTVETRDEQGDFVSTYNPLIMNPVAFLTIDDDSKTGHFFTTPNLEVTFSENLKVNVVGQVDVSNTNRSFYLPRITNNAQLPEGMAQKNESTIENYASEAYVTYTNDFENSSLTVVAGAGYYETQSQGFSLQGVGFFTDAFSYNNVEIAVDTDRNSISSFKSSRTKLSQFVRFNYSLHNKYIFSLVGRRDGSSIFSENHKYGYFPGGSVAWRVIQEDFMESFDSISDLKLRVGYGLTGNESVLSGNSLQLYNPGYPAFIGGSQYNGVALSQVANPDLTWEKNYTFNVGLDLGLWDNRVSGSVDYFVKTARDLLDFNPLPSNNAVGRVADNVGSTRSQGIEISLQTQNVVRNDFQWNSNLNVSYYKSHWLERNRRIPLADYVGKTDPIQAIYGWETDGIITGPNDIPSHMPDAFPGNVKYVDQNGDGELNSEDVVLLGSSNPNWSVGLNNTLSYKNFDLSVYVYGNFDFLLTNNYAPNVAGLALMSPQNTTDLVQNVWTNSQPKGKYPGVADNPYDGSNPTGTNDFWMEDGSFIRLQNVTLSYTLPNSLFGMNSPFRTASIFLNVEDLGVLTRYDGFDPEYTETNPYPRSYSTTMGLQLNF